MTDGQRKAAAAVKKALRQAHKVGLGLWVFDGSAYLGSSAMCRHDPRWNAGDMLGVLEDVGECINPIGMDCDGGAGR